VHAPHQLFSLSGHVSLDIQSDGNMVVYEGKERMVLWASGGTGATGDVHLDLQSDGNLVLYDQNGVLWATNTSSGSHLVLQDDCNLVLYGYSGISWATNIYCKLPTPSPTPPPTPPSCPTITASNTGPLDPLKGGVVEFSVFVNASSKENWAKCTEITYTWTFSDSSGSEYNNQTLNRTFDLGKLPAFPLVASVLVTCPSIPTLATNCAGYTELTGVASVSSTTIDIAKVGKISQCDPDSVVLEIPPGVPAPDLQVGHILAGMGTGSIAVNPECYSILRKISSTENVDATHIKITTDRNISFLDAFDSININSSSLLQHVSQDSSHISSTYSGVYGDPSSKHFSLPIDYEEGFSPVTGLTITPTFHMNPSLDLFVNKQSGESPVVRMSVSADLHAGVTLQGSLSASGSVSLNKNLYEHCFTGGLFFISFVPVYYQPCITIDGAFELNAEIDVTFTKSVTYSRTGMQFGFNYDKSMQKISNPGFEQLNNQPMSVTSGCTLTASATITPAFEVKFDSFANVKLGPTITVEGTAAAPPPKSYNGQTVSCQCNPQSGFLGAHLTAKATTSAGLSIISGASLSYDFFTFDKVLLNKCWTMPSSVAAACSQKAGNACACPSSYPVKCDHTPKCTGCMPTGADCCTNCKYCSPGNICKNFCHCCPEGYPVCKTNAQGQYWCYPSQDSLFGVSPRAHEVVKDHEKPAFMH
jgi:hypothetical protein